MKKILVISEFYHDETNANAHCIKMLVHALAQNGTAIDVITIGDKDEEIVENYNTTITFIRNRDENLCYGIRRIYRICKLLPKWPLEYPATAKEVIEVASRKIKRTEYVGILAVHKSFLSIYVSEVLKKKHSDMAIAAYLLDPIANEIDAKLGLRKYLYRKVIFEEKKCFSIFDYIFHMECSKKKYLKSDYDKYKKKFFFLDFPLIKRDLVKRRNSRCEITFDKKIILIYFGTLNSVYRSPAYMILVMKELKKYIDIEVHLFVKGDCLDIFDLYKELFKVYDYVSNEILEKEIKNSSVIMNIGNARSSMLPSKVIDMIMYGKPILSFSKQEDDVCDGYLEKYEDALIIKESMDEQEAVKEILNFFITYSNKFPVNDVNLILEKYKKNIPYFSSDLIQKVMMGNKA